MLKNHLIEDLISKVSMKLQELASMNAKAALNTRHKIVYMSTAIFMVLGRVFLITFLISIVPYRSASFIRVLK